MFCRFLSNTYHFTYDHVKPCCWMKNTPETQINIINIDNIKEKFKNLQQIDDWIPECSYCYDLEAAGTGSPRTLANNEPIFNPDDTVGEILKIELQLDEDCNAACLICGTWNSTTWQQYEIKTVKSNELSYRWITTVEERISTVIELVDFDKIKQINFFGGEPFNTDTQLKILKQIKYPENVKLIYTSNGSVFPSDETLELWKKFKSAHIGISIDGVGEQFNYLRWPLQWNQIENNLKKYLTLGDNITINTSFTATPFNIFYIDNYTKWAIDFANNNPTKKTTFSNWFLNPHPVTGIQMSMSCIPDELQEIIISKYGKESRIAKILNPFNKQNCQIMIDYIEFHDGHRKLNWRETFPEVVQYFENAI